MHRRNIGQLSLMTPNTFYHVSEHLGSAWTTFDGPTQGVSFFFMKMSEGANISDQLENVAHMYPEVQCHVHVSLSESNTTVSVILCWHDKSLELIVQIRTGLFW